MARVMDFRAFAEPPADDFDLLVEQFMMLTANHPDIISDTGLDTITGLECELLSGYQYAIELGIYVASASNTPDLDTKLAYSGTTSLWREHAWGSLAAITAIPATVTLLGTATVATEWTSGVTASEGFLKIEAKIITTSAGTLEATAAQNVSNATAVSIKAGSYLRVRPVA